MNKEKKQLLLQIVLFVITLITTTIAGAEWMFSKYLFWVREESTMTWSDFLLGFQFSIPFILILSVHEFGHYFTARYHHIKVTLPYYIPMWLGFILAPSFGTMGAFIRIKEHIYSLKHYFDVGISGPLAGFVIAIGVIWYGYSHLPEPEHIFEIYPEYEQFGLDYADHVYSYEFSRLQDSLRYLELRAEDSLASVNDTSSNWSGYPCFQAAESYPSMYFGKPVIFNLAEALIVSEQDKIKIPNDQEIMHNPYLLAGLLALFFTALNLLPIGQLDGGHILFGLVGEKRHFLVSRVLFTCFVFYAGLGLVSIKDLPDVGINSTFEFLFVILIYLYFLYVCAHSLFETKTNRMTFAAVIFTTQFLTNFIFGFEGYSGWLLFAFLLGRVLGVRHPSVMDNRPLSTGRKVLGWIALLIFVLCFTPEPFVIDY
ncbi:MAG: site-2 protease family protein [Marinoscillum sp.]